MNKRIWPGLYGRGRAWCFVIALIFGGLSSALGQIIPADRTIPWSPSVEGVPAGLSPVYSNGVPYRTTIWKNAATYGCDTNGVVDCSGQLSWLIANCPAGQVIYLPAGKYLVNNMVNIGKVSEITLRGAGMGKTVIIDGCASSHICLFWIGTGNPEGGVNLLSSNTKGATNLVVSATSSGGYSMFPGCMVVFGQHDDTNFVHNLVNSPYWGAPTTATNNLTQTTMVTALNGTNITVWPPLIWNFTNGWCCIFAPGTAFHDSIEDLTITHINPTTGAIGQCSDSIFAIQCSQCWFRDVESAFTPNYHFAGYYLNQCTIRDCYFHEASYYGPSQGVGVLFYQWCCNSLVENNILYRCSPAMEINNGSSGNVFTYNYSYETLDSSPSDQPNQIILADFDCNHGPHNIMNLWEGNVGTTFQSDSYFGSCSHQTLFRNNFTAAHPLANQFLRAVDLGSWSYYFSLVGNVLGTPPMTNLVGQPLWTGGGVYDVSVPGFTYTIPVIYRFGYPHMGNNNYTSNMFNPMPSNYSAAGDGPHDADVEATILEVANYDYLHNGVVNPTNNLPPSLFYTSQPSWWVGTNWPPIGPDLSPMVSQIPAQIQFSSIMNQPTNSTPAVNTNSVPPTPKNLHVAS